MQQHIIHFLKTNENFLSGEEISRSLNISRAGIWKHIEDLRRQGYDIEAVPHLGYRLRSCPDKLLPGEIAYNLGTKIIGQQVIYHDKVQSTMDEAFQLGIDGAREGTVVCAETQLKGRGRMGRNWVSPKGKGVYMSVLLRPPLSPADVARLTLLAAVAVCEAVQKITRITVAIKWPNDLLVNNKKLAGMLTELSAEIDRIKFVVIGIGLNVNTPASQLPAGATSLRQQTGQTYDRVMVVQEILRSLEKWYATLKTDGFGPVTERWEELSATLGRHVSVSDADRTIEGEAIGLAEDGGLLIRNETGLLIKKVTGDVIQTG